jgi:glycosyltransferase involved in cell wall biosynthesis
MDSEATNEIMGAAVTTTAHGTPWASFCLATYRRPERLRQVLSVIASQSFTDFEVIVSDNDPAQSSRETVERFDDARFRYFSNAENVGMVKNFNVALKHARGQYVVMITDDDPPYPMMLSVLHELTLKLPGYGAYYGACEVMMENDAVAETHGTGVGKLTFRSPAPEGTVRTYDPGEFLRAFFRRQIFRYMLWSTGIVARDIAVQIGGMPDYGAAFLTDFAYMGLAGAQRGFVAVNTVLGYQVVHGQNAGFTEPHALRKSLDGCHAYMSERLAGRPDWDALRPLMENFLGVYIVGHIASMRQHLRKAADGKRVQETFDTLATIPYVRKLRVRYIGLSLLYSVPALQWLYKVAKRLQTSALRAWPRAS